MKIINDVNKLCLIIQKAWQLAGSRIVDFCQGTSIILLQETKPIPGDTVNLFHNIIPKEVTRKRVAEVGGTPLLERVKREIMLDNHEGINTAVIVRTKRQGYRPGKFRGQTQSQYLTLGAEGQKEGKAEAEATDHSSRAVVSE